MKKILGFITRNKVWQRLVILAVLGIAVYVFLPQIADLENAWQVLTSLDLAILGLAFMAQVLSYLSNGLLLQSILAIAHQKVSLWLNTLIVLGSTSIGLVAGGMIGSAAAIYRWTRGGTGSRESATLASIFLPLFNDIVLVLVSIYGLVHLIVIHRLTQIETIGFGVILLILGLVIGSAAITVRCRIPATRAFIWISGRIARLRRKSFDPNATRQQASNLYGFWDALWRDAWPRLVEGAVLNVAFDVVTLYLIFIAAGDNISPAVLLAGYGLPLLLGKVAFFLPGGVGAVETSMAVLYYVLGVPQATAAVVVLGYRLISFWIPSLIGFPVAAYLQRSQRKSPQGQEIENPNK